MGEFGWIVNEETGQRAQLPEGGTIPEGWHLESVEQEVPAAEAEAGTPDPQAVEEPSPSADEPVEAPSSEPEEPEDGE